MTNGFMTTTTNQPIFIPYKGKAEITQLPQSTGTAKAKIVVPDVADLGHSKLLACLYFIFDAMERCGLQYFLIRDTAKKAITEYMLEGDTINIGVRRNEWENDQKDVLFSYLENEHAGKVSELPNEITYQWQDVKFTIHIYEDNPLLLALVPIVYENEHWMVPNNFDEFEEKCDK